MKHNARRGVGGSIQAYLPVDEPLRLAALRRYRILDTGPESEYDDIARVAAYVCGTPIALVSFVDEDRQWFKARVGLTLSETPRNDAFCAHTILQKDVLVVPDASADERFSASPLVLGGPAIRFYAAAPLLTPDGYPIGTLCVLDGTPRDLDEGQVGALRALARQVVANLELRQRIADLTAARTALEESERRYAVISHATNDAVWDWDITAGTVTWGEAFHELFGYQLGELEPGPESWITRIHPDDVERVVQGIHAALDGEASSWSDEYRFRRADGAYARVFDRGWILRGPDGKSYRAIGAMVDVTERRLLQEQLLQAQKMDALGRLAGGVAHDFNNILTAILGYASLLRERLPEGSASRRDADEIRLAGERAATLTRQLLAFGRRQVLVPEVLDLDEVVSGMARLLERALGEDVRLVLELEPRLAPVRADRGQLEQVLMNLAMNAHDAMPGGGTVTVATGGRVLAERLEGAAGSVPPGDYVVLSVRDTGVGMTDAARARIFEPFYTTKERGKGTGLGLSIVHGVVRQSGGTVVVASEPERGSTFEVLLPALPRGALSPPPRAESRAEVARGSETILLVDDDGSVRRLAREVLERSGYTVLDAETGPQALAVARAHAAEIRLVLTDVVMPGMTGPELVSALKDVIPAALVLYMSANAEDALGGREIAGAWFLEKPFAPQALERKVRDLLDGAA